MDILGIPESFMTMNEHGQQQFADMNKGCHPEFKVIYPPNTAESEKLGRPVTHAQEICIIHTPGDRGSLSAQPVDDQIKRRFSAQYKAWKEAKSDAENFVGTLLKDWGALSEQQVIEFNMSRLFTVEMVSEMPDTTLDNIANGREWRGKARAWLETTKDAAASMKWAAEAERMRVKMDEMAQQIALLQATEANAPVHRGPGRPRAEAA